MGVFEVGHLCCSGKVLVERSIDLDLAPQADSEKGGWDGDPALEQSQANHCLGSPSPKIFMNVGKLQLPTYYDSPLPAFAKGTFF